MQTEKKDSVFLEELEFSKIRHDLVSVVGLLQSVNYNLGKKAPRIDLAKLFCNELITRVDSLVSRMDEVIAKGAK